MRQRSKITISAALAVIMTATMSPAEAADDGEYAEWAADGSRGEVMVPVKGFPDATFTTNSASTKVPSGKSTWLSESTPFGAEFGKSENKQYLLLRPKTQTEASTTDIKFEEPTPSKDWGFTLGDVDADFAEVSAIGVDGKPLSAAELGFQSTFNYCRDDPKPPTCKDSDGKDEPKVITGANKVRLSGNRVDTAGSSGWFMPTRPIKTLTIKIGRLTGIPIVQLWLAAKGEFSEPDIDIKKTASPRRVKPGATVTYTVTVTNKGSKTEEHGEFSDDLSDVIDDATYNNDATATSGDVTYDKPKITWKGAVEPGETHTITYSVTVGDPPKGNRKLRNVVIGFGTSIDCRKGKDPNCTSVVKIRKKKGGRGGTWPGIKAEKGLIKKHHHRHQA